MSFGRKKFRVQLQGPREGSGFSFFPVAARRRRRRRREDRASTAREKETVIWQAALFDLLSAAADLRLG